MNSEQKKEANALIGFLESAPLDDVESQINYHDLDPDFYYTFKKDAKGKIITIDNKY